MGTCLEDPSPGGILFTAGTLLHVGLTPLPTPAHFCPGSLCLGTKLAVFPPPSCPKRGRASHATRDGIWCAHLSAASPWRGFVPGSLSHSSPSLLRVLREAAHNTGWLDDPSQLSSLTPPLSNPSPSAFSVPYWDDLDPDWCK